MVRLVHLLSTPPLRSVRELADYVGKTTRTVYRYLESLEEMGLPLYEETGRYGLLEAAYLPPLNLDMRETLALYLSVAIAEGRLGGLSPALMTAFGKLRRRLSHGDALDDLSGQLLAPALTPGAGTELETLSAAIADRREVSFLYRPLGAAEGHRRAHPQSLFLYQDAWYLWAFDLDRQAQRRFRLSRLRELRVTDSEFCADAAEDPLYHRWDRGDGEPIPVTLRVTPALAEWLAENPPHPSLRLCSGICRLHVREPGSMLSYLLGLEGVTVLEPSWLGEQLRQRALEIAGQYAVAGRPTQSIVAPDL